MSKSKRLALLFAFCGVIILGALWVTERIATQRTVSAERANLQGLAALAASNYKGHVDKFELVAVTLAASPDVKAALIEADQNQFLELNRRLAQLTADLDASVIYIMNAQGETIASSNWQADDSFLGEDYSFRPYFQRALSDGSWRQYAKGTRSKIPGLFVAHRIDGPDSTLGVLVVKIRFDKLEERWSDSIGDVFVTNSDGVVLVTSRPENRFRTLTPVSSFDAEKVSLETDYGSAHLEQLSSFGNNNVLIGDDYQGQDFIEVATQISEDRELHVIAPLKPALASARNFAWLGVAFSTVLLFSIGLALYVRRRSHEQKQEREHQSRLADLKMRLEQASRLSFLGQIAAGVGHELNQPLGAIGLRADAARKLIERGRLDQAEEALREIDALVLRAGNITGELRNFSRRSDRSEQTTQLKAALDGVSLLIGDRIRKSNARLILDNNASDVWVECEQGRLEQVLVNLIQNALDAGGDKTVIDISSLTKEDHVQILVKDNGPGIEEETKANLFQPFSTTKQQGLGLGLVICRDIVADYGGEISLQDAEHGTCFEVLLRRAA